jgi:hypothetical protein
MRGADRAALAARQRGPGHVEICGDPDPEA